MKPASRRSEELMTVAQEMIRVHDAWVDDGNRPNPDSIYWDAVDAVNQSFSAGTIPSDCRTLAEAAAGLSKEVEVFNQREDEGTVYPRAEFWGAIQGIREALADTEEPELRPLESIQALDKQKVPHRQIALIYGLVDREGNPQGHLIQQELDKPGSVIDDNWIDPRIRERQAAENAASEHAERLESKGRAADRSPPCKETVEELWQQGVGARQAAKMLHRRQEDVQAEYERLDNEREANQRAIRQKELEEENAAAVKKHREQTERNRKAAADAEAAKNKAAATEADGKKGGKKKTAKSK